MTFTKKWGWVAFASALGLTVGLATLLLTTPETPGKPVPQPNGYDDIVAAVGLLPLGDIPSPNNTTLAELQACISTNRAALERVRQGLGKQCRIDPLLKATEASSQQFTARLSGQKKLALCLVAEGDLARLQHHPGEAANSYLDAIQLGYELARGGALIEVMVANACETMGITALKRMAPELDAAQAREAVRRLEKLEAAREPFENTIVREREFGRGHGLWASVAYKIASRSWDPVGAMCQKYHTKILMRQRDVIHLCVSLAVRAFEQEKGRKPTGYGDLVPEYLAHAPSPGMGDYSFQLTETPAGTK